MGHGGGDGGELVGRGEYLIDFSRVSVAGLSPRASAALAAFFLAIAAAAFYVMVLGGGHLLGAILVGVLLTLAVAQVLLYRAARSTASALGGARFRLGYEVRAGGDGYIVGFRLSAESPGSVGSVRLFLVRGLSYAMQEIRYRYRSTGPSIRVLRGGGELYRRLVIEEVGEGYARGATLELPVLECASTLGLGTFRLVTGAFAVLEADAGAARGYAIIPLVFAPMLNAGAAASATAGDVAVRVEVERGGATLEALLSSPEGYRRARVGVAYLVDVSFQGGKRFRREIRVPVAEVAVTGRSVRVRLDAGGLLSKLARATGSKPGDPELLPLITTSPYLATYAAEATRGNLRLPPPLASSVHGDSGVRVAYYLELRGRLRSRVIMVEAPLPPSVAGRPRQERP